MDIIGPLFDWISANPAWAGFVVMLIALFESLAFVGLFLPGAVMMFGVGALVGAGHLALWPTLIWAALGAIAGDGISFLLGKHFHQRIRVMWPFRTHPQLMTQSTDFFHRHGGKSVLLGRFIGPIRPVIPVVAGMLDMPGGRFALVNIISGILWAPVYVIPGMVFAASLGIAAEVATRLAMLLGLVFLLLLIVAWLIRRLFNLFHPRAHYLISRILDWSRLHPVLGRLPAAVLDPETPEARGLTFMAIVLLFSAALFVWIMSSLGQSQLLFNLDHFIFFTLQDLRVPSFDRLMIGLLGFTSIKTLGLLFIGLAVWLGIERQWQSLAHWLAALLFAIVSSLLLPLLDLFDTAFLIQANTDYQLLAGFILYGFLTAMLAREMSDRWRWLIYLFSAFALVLIGFSHLYLGLATLSEVLGKLTLGLTWATLLGIAYRRHPIEHLPGPTLGLISLLLIIPALFWTPSMDFRSAKALPSISLTQEHWLNEGWQQLAQRRGDLRGKKKHPFNLQYAGDLNRLQRVLEQQGWKKPRLVNAINWLQWFDLNAAPGQQALLPQVHDGHYQSLFLVKETPSGELLALRLWKSQLHLTPGQGPLWVGNASYLKRRTVLGSLAIPHTGNDFDGPLKTLHRDLGGTGLQPTIKTGEAHEVLLLNHPTG